MADTAGERADTLVLLCRSLEGRGNGLDLNDIREWFHETDFAVQVEVADDICRRPGAVSMAGATGTRRLVLALCSGDYPEMEMHPLAREAGLDPFGVEMVNLGGHCASAHPRAQATDKAKVLLAAAVARARAFPGSSPENVRPLLARGGQKMSRRALFTLPPIRHQPVVSIQRELCAGETGCQRCLEVCPRGALSKRAGRVVVAKSGCCACALCLVECPRAAIELPTHSLPQLEAETAALLESTALAPSEPRAILFVCQESDAALAGLSRKGVSLQPGWLPVKVPCAGMVATGWLLQCLAQGADAVGVVGCAGSCALDQQEGIEGRVSYCRELLSLLGGPPDAVRLVRPSPETALAEALSQPLGRRAPERAGGRERPSLTRREATAGAVRSLAGVFDSSPDLSLAHPFSPLGLVRLDAEKCTACGACARACPTDALSLHEGDGAVSLSFEPASCTACRQCIGWCPEASQEAIHVESVTDLHALSKGRATLYESREVRCELCGAVIGPAAMLQRIEAVLTRKGGANSATIAAITRRCLSCRGAALVGARPAARS